MTTNKMRFHLLSEVTELRKQTVIVLANFGIFTATQLLAHVNKPRPGGQYWPVFQLSRIPRCGRKTTRELAEWLGLSLDKKQLIVSEPVGMPTITNVDFKQEE